ncbi:extracellular solute-binding protein [Aestuariimicrobium ganziense]|uniref:extracellular solute-binding protein n=1 Tax=Aestuariimicrobium ganziense TaxID=2773677 RepID=UPI001943AC55|nr:extracellular solute-binding protein [Aestuariimicrobium ganziense]
MRLRGPAVARVAGVVAVVMALILTGCSGGRDRTLVVWADASLRAPFLQFAKVLQDTHPGTTVTVRTGGSAVLAGEIAAGAEVDVFASAGPGPMSVLAGRPGDVDRIASTTLLLVTAKGNPEGIATLNQLTRGGITVAACRPSEPCGAMTDEVLQAAGVTLTPGVLVDDTATVLEQVMAGEVDAGFVYATDAEAAGADVYVVDDPVFQQHRSNHQITVLADSRRSELAGEFRDLVLSKPGQSLLDDFGFGAP